jgi:hypothetical protein
MGNLLPDHQLKFLEEASLLLSAQSPIIAANLSSEGTRIVLEAEREMSQCRKVGVCQGCGSRLTPGQTSKVSVECGGRKKKTRQREAGRRMTLGREGKASLPELVDSKILVVRCLACQSRATLPLPQETKAKIGEPPTTLDQDIFGLSNSTITATNTEASGTTNPTIAPSTTTRTRRKAKARKQNTLQALLATAKRTQDTPAGLDLLDFMKSSS